MKQLLQLVNERTKYEQNKRQLQDINLSISSLPHSLLDNSRSFETTASWRILDRKPETQLKKMKSHFKVARLSSKSALTEGVVGKVVEGAQSPPNTVSMSKCEYISRSVVAFILSDKIIITTARDKKENSYKYHSEILLLGATISSTTTYNYGQSSRELYLNSNTLYINSPSSPEIPLLFLDKQESDSWKEELGKIIERCTKESSESVAENKTNQQSLASRRLTLIGLENLIKLGFGENIMSIKEEEDEIGKEIAEMKKKQGECGGSWDMTLTLKQVFQNSSKPAKQKPLFEAFKKGTLQTGSLSRRFLAGDQRQSVTVSKQFLQSSKDDWELTGSIKQTHQRHNSLEAPS